MAGLLSLLAFGAPAEQWIDLFGRDGIAGNVLDASFMEDQVLISGSFYSVAGERAESLANYDLTDRRWDILPGGGRGPYVRVAGLRVNDELTLVTESFYRLQRHDSNGIHEFEDLGSVSIDSLLSITLDQGQRIVAAGRFGGLPDDSLAVWDGSVWTGLGDGSRRHLNGFVFEKDGRMFFGAMRYIQDGHFSLIFEGLFLWDGSVEQTIQLPGIPDAAGIAALNGNLIICENQQLLSWDGFSLQPMAVSLPDDQSCSDLRFRASEQGDQLVAGRWISDGENSWSVDLERPQYCTDQVSAHAGRLATVSGDSSNYGEVCIWDGRAWTRAMDQLVSSKPPGVGYPLYPSAVGPISLAVSPPTAWTDRGFEAQSLGYTPARGAVPSFDLSQSFSINGLNLQIESSAQTQQLPLDVEFTFARIAGTSPAGVIIAADNSGDVQYLVFDGKLRPLGSRIPGYSFIPVVHFLPETSPTPGYYTLSLEGVSAKSCAREVRFPIRRFFNGQWSDITPPEFPTINSCDEPVISVVEYEGELRLFAALGEHLGYFTQAGWLLFRPNPGAFLLGPVAIISRADEPCFLVADRTDIHRLCGEQWSQPAELRTYQPYVGEQQIWGFQPATYLGRPVLLVRGFFDAAGPTAQPGIAVLDLDSLFSDGLEAP